MQNVETRNTRNFALVGHTADGKTSLGEAFLHAVGATSELGKVDEGSSVLDHTTEEKERHHTLSCSLYGFDWNDLHVTLVDTPGDPNFQGDGQIALHALDGAVLIVSSVDGTQVGTESMWRAAERAGTPMVAFVNGMDRDRANFQETLESLRQMGANPIEVVLPIGSGADFKGWVNLLEMNASLEGRQVDIPAELAEEAAAARQRLVDAVAECDDELLERYLEEGELDGASLIAGLVSAVNTRSLLPVLCGSAVREIGTAESLRLVTQLLPGPLERGERSGRTLDDDSEIAVSPDPAGPFAALVFKTVVDRYAGTLSVFRVFSGTIKADTPILNATRGKKERLGKLLLLRGSEYVDVPEAGPGDIVAVAKLKDVHTGDALTQEKGGVHLPEIPIPEGALSYAIGAKTKGEEDKVFTSLGRLVEEDPTLHLGRDASTGEFLLTGMGELHIRMTVKKLRRLYDVEVDLKTPKVPYRETITRKAENVEGKLKKQTGGKGMFGVCYLTLEPLPRGAGIEFVDEIVGGSIPRNLIPAVEKGIQESSGAGPLAGYPVVDVRVRCIDGKHHSVDSNEMAFKLAGSFGFKAGIAQGKPTLLEPIMNAEIVVPDDYVGDVMGDVSSRRGRVQSSEARGSAQVIKAEVPMAEMLEYASSLTSLTGGKGAFQMEFSHYDEVPAQVQEKIIAEAKAKQAEES